MLKVSIGMISIGQTSSFLLHLLSPLLRPPSPFLLFLFLSTSMKVFHDDPDEHVQDEESDQKDERDKV